MSKTYSSKSNAARAAKKAGLNESQYSIVLKGKRFQLRDLTTPLYNGSLRERSTAKSPCLIVWDLCFEMGANVKRKELLARAVELGVNESTAKTQYQAWRKAEGLVKS